MTKTKHRILTTFCILLFAFCIFCAFGSVSASGAESYTVKFVNIGYPGTSFSGDSTVAPGTDYTFKITINQGYALDNLLVFIGEIVEDNPYEGYTYNSSDGTFTIPGEDVTGDISIFTYPVVKKYTVTVDGSNLTLDNNQVAADALYYEATLTPAEGYALPKTIKVSCGGVEVPMDITSGYWYWADIGLIHITDDYITDDIVITASAVDIPRYQVTLRGTGMSLEALEDREGGAYRARVIAAEGYALPNTVTVKLDGELRPQDTYEWNTAFPGYFYIDMIYLYKNDGSYKTIEIDVEGVSGSFNVSFFGSGIAFPTEATATAGTDYTVTLTAQNGYTLPDAVNVSIGNIGTPTSFYTYDKSTGLITIPGEIINGDIGINANGVAVLGQTVSVELMDNTLSLGENTTATSGTDYTATLTPAPGYTLPESILVFSGSTALILDTDFTYDQSTGGLAIQGAAIMSNIRINAQGVPNTYSVAFLGTNLSIEGGSSVTAGATYTAILTVGEGYSLPASITVTVGGTVLPDEKYYYQKSVNAGTVTIYGDSISGDIVITATGVVRIYEVNLSGAHLSLNGDTTAIGNKDYTVEIVSEIGYDVPYDVDLNVGGIYLTWGQYNWDRDTQQLTIYGQYINGNIVIIAEAVTGYEVHFNGTNVSSDGKGVAFGATDYTAKLTADDGYILPETIVVTVDGTVIESGVEYTYDSVTGELTISGNYLYSDVNIIAEGIHVHQWDSGEITKDPTCSAVGAKTFTCTYNSAHTKTEDVAIDENAHAWKNGEVTTQPTCSAVGVKTFTCTHNSAHTKTEDVAIDANAHAWNEGVVTTDPTCSVVGVKTFTCTHNSEHIKTEDVNALGHVYDNVCDTTCNTCGEERIPADHVDEDENNTCDICGSEISKDGLSGGAVAGIVVGSTAAVGLGGFSLFWFVIKKKKWSDLIGIFKK